MQIRDRIKEFRRVKARDLRPNPKNWRTHPENQQNALRGVLAEVGYADAVLARELPDGGLELIDGHLRAETTPDQEIPVLVLDVDEAEADKLLATVDPLAEMAGTDSNALGRLLESVSFRSDATAELLKGLQERIGDTDHDAGGTRDGAELEISPELFERHDYLVVRFENEWDWKVACERLGVKTVQNAVVDPSSTIRQKGLSRVIDAKVLLRELGYGT